MQIPLSKMLKHYRVDEGLTLPELAHKIGVSIATLSRIENGKGELRVKTWESIRRWMSGDNNGR